MIDHEKLSQAISFSLQNSDYQSARYLAYRFLEQWANQIPGKPRKADLRVPKLWESLADVVERTSDQHLIERFWQILESNVPDLDSPIALPLLGVPILNRADLLIDLLDSLDHPVETLAIVDNSPTFEQTGSKSVLNAELTALVQLGHPLIERIQIARPFRNLGVAASWNLILTSFPQASAALIANNDVCFTPGLIQAAMESVNPDHPQFMPLLPAPNHFSAFLITPLCWERIGLFDTGFYPAYYEDLEYWDRLRSDPEIDLIENESWTNAMADLNPNHSATINSDPQLKEQNKISFGLNRLWYLSQRRLRGDRRGSWRRLWLSQWEEPSDLSDESLTLRP